MSRAIYYRAGCWTNEIYQTHVNLADCRIMIACIYPNQKWRSLFWWVWVRSHNLHQTHRFPTSQQKSGILFFVIHKVT